MSNKKIKSLAKLIFSSLILCFSLNGFSQQNDQNDSPIDDATRKRFAKAQPEDITNENFPDLIDSFDYPNADISEVVKAISKLTGKNFIIDPAANRGKITIIAPTPITIAEAYRAFLSALAINNYTVVPSGNFLKIRQVTTAQNDSIETYTDYFPNTDQVITRIVKLKYISAEDLASKIKYLKSRQGILEAYGPTNSLIITDFGSNIERISRILAQLDVPGFEEQLAVIRIYNAKSKEIQTLVDQIINKGESKNSRSVPRFRRNKKSSTKTGAESYSLVVSDDRTNSIVVMGNKAGIKRIKALVKKLDFPLNPEDAGGVYVYYVRHGEAEKIANVINGVASDSKKANDAKTGGSGVTKPRSSTKTNNAKASSGTSLFGGEVKVTADETTNSLIVTASRQDYDVMKGLLAKIDIPRDQVFVKAIIMEMRAEKKNSWGISYFKFKEGTGGLGRVGFAGINDLTSLFNPIGGAGAILGFGAGSEVSIPNPLGGEDVQIKSLTGLVNFIKSNNGGNVLSSPQLTVMDNEEANIAVGQTIPVGTSTTSGTGGSVSESITREEATIDLTIKPHISPDTDQVQMEIEQKIKQLANTQVQASRLADSSVVTNDRNIKTRIAVDSGDTAVLGGLMQDTETGTVRKVPILGDIPILGWLFKTTDKTKSKLNLVMFITPKILRNSDDGAEIVDTKINERIDFIQSFMNGKDPHGYTIDTLPRKSSRRTVAPELDIEDSLEQDFNPALEEPATDSF